MKNYKLIWGGKKNTKVLRMLEESGPGQGAYGGAGATTTNPADTGGTTTTTYIEPTGETQSYPINQVLVTPGNLTAWGSLTINWLNNPIQEQTHEVDATQNWWEEQEQKYNQQQDTDDI